MKRILAGAAVITTLREPREKYWGVLDEVSPAGVYLRGIDLNAFEDFVRAVLHGEPFFGMSDSFFPMWRVERLTRDERTSGLPSLVEQFESRTGHSLEGILRSIDTVGDESEAELLS